MFVSSPYKQRHQHKGKGRILPRTGHKVSKENRVTALLFP